VSQESRRLCQQSADLAQTNNQRTDQANTQDASYHSSPRQDLAFRGHLSQVDEQRVTVTVQNHLAAPGLQDAGRLVVAVADGAGLPLPDCVVEVYFGPLTGVPVAIAETDRLGQMRVDDLPPGFYSLRIVGPDGTWSQLWNQRVTAAREARLQAVLPGLAPGPARSRDSSSMAPR